MGTSVKFLITVHHNDSYVRAFRFQKAPDNRIEMLCKGSPSDKNWCGLNGVQNGPGFIILKSIPHNAPPVIPPSKFTEKTQKSLATLGSASVQSFCETTGLGDSHTWLMELVETGEIPSHGSVCVPGALFDVPFRPVSPFWARVLVSSRRFGSTSIAHPRAPTR